MSSLLEGAKKLVTRGSSIGARVEGLDVAIGAARGRLDDEVLDDAQRTVDRAASRIKLSSEHTVVALAGATGSGKSSTFNALTELELSAVGVRRPTTSWATACVWGKEGAEELLDWLGIPPRHQVTRDSMLSVGREDATLNGVVLLDLPDHDSTEVSHHLEVDRLVEMADLLVWVLDPQKYADAAIHDRYLAPLKAHKDIMVVVLNHIDTVPENRRGAMLDDVRRLLAEDGLDGVPVLSSSAREGWGIAELKAQIAKRAKEKRATRARLEADLHAAAERVAEISGTAPAPALDDARLRALEEAFAEAAGVPTVVKAVEDSARMRAARATGWPVVSWFSRLRPDPLKRLHLDLGDVGKELVSVSRTGLPAPTQVQRARVDTEVRELADQLGASLTPPWAKAVRAASTARMDDLGDGLDRAVGATELDLRRLPWWAQLVRVFQWLLITAALVGGAWLLLLALGSYAGLSAPPTPEVAGWPLPLLLFGGGVLLGIVLAVVCRVLVGSWAKSRARNAERQLMTSISEVGRELVVAPVTEELAAYQRVREGLVSSLR
jgi:GTPase Era involved in 16S rRNA processing